MSGGYWFSKNVELGFQKSLAEQGLPIDLGMTAAVIGVFIILFPLLKSFYFDPLAEAIQARSSELEKTFAEAENLRAEMTQMRTEYEQRISTTEQEAREQIQAQIREAQTLADHSAIGPLRRVERLLGAGQHRDRPGSVLEEDDHGQRRWGRRGRGRAEGCRGAADRRERLPGRD